MRIFFVSFSFVQYGGAALPNRLFWLSAVFSAQAIHVMESYFSYFNKYEAFVKDSEINEKFKIQPFMKFLNKA
jgi:hypothetical protein